MFKQRWSHSARTEPLFPGWSEEEKPDFPQCLSSTLEETQKESLWVVSLPYVCRLCFVLIRTLEFYLAVDTRKKCVYWILLTTRARLLRWSCCGNQTAFLFNPSWKGRCGIYTYRQYKTPSSLFWEFCWWPCGPHLVWTLWRQCACL